MRDNKERRLIIDLKGIKKRFFEGTENEIEVLKGIDLQVYEGEFVSIVGASGSGKSTLMNIIGALDRASEGSYLLDGVDINQADDNELSHIRNKKIGFVFQTYNLIPRISALKNVERPMLYAKVPGAERTERAKELLKLVGMEDRMKHNPDELSGEAEGSHSPRQGQPSGHTFGRRAHRRPGQQDGKADNGHIPSAQPRAGHDDSAYHPFRQSCRGNKTHIHLDGRRDNRRKEGYAC